MKKLAVIDFMHIYYRYKYAIESGNIEPLSYEGRDTTLIYFVVSSVVKMVNEQQGNSAICFDSRSDKQQSADGIEAGYKKKRKAEKKLTQKDIYNIYEIRMILEGIGYNTYQLDGYEADDIVACIVGKYSHDYEMAIYTNDTDLAQLIGENVSLRLYSSYDRKYSPLNIENYESVLSRKFKSYVPYNTIKLYKSLCGDKSDEIPGVNRFGPKAFEKFIRNVIDTGVDLYTMTDDEMIQSIANEFENDAMKLHDAMLSFRLVTFLDINMKPSAPTSRPTAESAEVVLKYGMKSVYKKLCKNI